MNLPIDAGPTSPWWDRFVAIVVVGTACGFVLMLSQVPVDPRGYGTHEALGMGACAWPEQYGLPCPTCGVTTAAANLVQLSPWRAIVTQPFGVAFALLGLWCAVVAATCLVRQRSFLAWVAVFPIGRILLIGLLLLLASWGYKVLTWPAPS